MATRTRDRLLDAALLAFASKGVDGTAITELEEAAGLAPGSGGFYRYYRTKEEALDAAVRREIDRVTAERGSSLRDRPEVEAHTWLTDEFDRALDTMSTLGPLIAILARERSRIPDLAREIATRLVEGGARHDEGLVAAVRPDATPSAGDAALGAVIVSAIVGYHLAHEYFGAPPGGVGRDDFVAALVDLVLAQSATNGCL